ncbi:apolipo protein O-domain-containing protein [Mycena rosella]|uniref:MICOS complex subunit n=1 Tax=Mycena rosella TaxID=1033263 RepID=A0AAD7CV13_MYCRO|nr:apolipo protein O-domain-containing protein [Mycena rosella]
MQSDSPQQRKKPSIYAAPPAEILLLDTPSALEAHIGTARRAVTGRYLEAHAHVQGLVSSWIGVENRVEHRIKSLLPPDERLVPGALYAAIAFLSGAILARHRALPIRAILPPVLGVAAATHFLPKTSANVGDYLGGLEDHYAPEVARVHEVGKAHTRMTWDRLSEGVEGGRARVREGVLAAVERLQGATGLKVREALGVARSIEEKAEKVIEEKIADFEGVVEKTEKKAEEAAKDRVV